MRKTLLTAYAALLSVAGCGSNQEPLFKFNAEMHSGSKILRVYKFENHYERGYSLPSTLFLIDVDGDGKIDQSLGLSGAQCDNLGNIVQNNIPNTVYAEVPGLKLENKYVVPSERVVSTTMDTDQQNVWNKAISALNSMGVVNK